MYTPILFTRTSRTSRYMPDFIGFRNVPTLERGSRTSWNTSRARHSLSDLSESQGTHSEHIKAVCLPRRPSCPICPSKKTGGS